MGEHETRHPVGQGRLADALRPADQPGMGNPPAAIGIQQRALGLAVPKQYAGLTRRRNRNFLLGLLCTHAGAAEVDVARRRLRNSLKMCAATASGLTVVSITTQRRGSSAAICR